MKLYTGLGPNPRVVHIFMAEKGMEIPLSQVDLMAGENRQADHLSRNPSGQLPTLELDNGSFIAEITAICEYLDEVGPAPSLLGDDAQERAETRMWARRIDLNINEPLTTAFRGAEGHGLFNCGARFSLADILLYAFLEFGGSVGQPLNPKLERLQAWYTRVAARPSIEASRT